MSGSGKAGGRDYKALLREALETLDDMRGKLKASEKMRNEPIAIVGASCRLPGHSNTPDAFWELLHNGTDAVTEIPKSRWDIDAYYDPDPEAPGKMYCRYASFIDDVETFDAQFFHIAPREATVMDPQQRLLLETSWEALENAGVPPDGLAGSRTGVFIGVSTNDYSEWVASRIGNSGNPYAGTGNTDSVVAGRLSYTLGLNGPCFAVDTACSSSLVALHSACQSLRNGDCSAALTGGVNLMLTPTVSINFCKAHMLSADGSCKTFDAAANGYVRGEGVAMIVLKRLSDAVADGDRILALVKSTAINQDGRSGGLTVPNGTAQQSLMRDALRAGGLEPTDLDYIEAHGTGTSLGDPIELEALGGVFGKARQDTDPLWVGSVKTNIGHLEAAAGITGLLKVVLALQNEEIPPHLHFHRPTPHLDWDAASLRVPTEPVPWRRGDRPRRAGVSSFGFSGTNAHVILEEAPLATEPDPSQWERPRHLLTISAKNAEALDQLADAYERVLRHSNASLADICFTAAAGRSHFNHRLALPAATETEAANGLVKLRSGEDVPGATRHVVEGNAAPRVAFLFTGQGSQYIGMGRELYETQPVFRRVMDQCDELVREYLDVPLLSVIYAEEGADSPINETAYTQPALFAIEYALAEMWKSWGIRPAWTLGHSVGEFVAACVAGVFSLEDGLKLIAARGRLMQALPKGGAMVAVGATAARVATAIAGHEDKVSVATLNSPRQVALSGEEETLKSIVAELEADDLQVHWLRVSHAFHSPLMEPMLPEFRKVCEEVTFAEPQISLISNVAGGLAGAEVQTAEYWCRHVREPVRFCSGIQALAEDGARIMLEVGAKPILTLLGPQCVEAQDVTWLTTLNNRMGNWEQALESLGSLYAHGVKIDWRAYDAAAPRRYVGAPTYAFQRRRFWVDMIEDATGPSVGLGGGALMGHLDEEQAEALAADLAASHEFSEEQQKLLPDLLMAMSETSEQEAETDPLQDAFYDISWEERPYDGPSALDDVSIPLRSWVVLSDDGGVGKSVAQRLRDLGHGCVIAPRSDDPALDVAGLLEQASGNEALPLGGVLHFWNLDAPDPSDATADAVEAAQECGCVSVLRTIQAVLDSGEDTEAQIWVVTRGGQATGTDGETINPTQSPVWGFGRVAQLEHAEVWGGLVDLGSADETETDQMLQGILMGDVEDQVAIRGATRYVPRLAPVEGGDAPSIEIHDDGSYLIAGGVGALGRAVAQWLIAQGAKHLVLTSRRGAASTEAQEAVVAMTEAGAEVRVVKADVADSDAMAALFDELAASDQPLRGIVHAAGIAAVAAMREMTPEQLTDVLRSKVAGGWNLERLSRDLPLDFFVLFSSISSVWGSAGQSHYAAANQYLDVLAHYRNSQGRTATSVNWGPWAGSGMATADARAWLTQMGITALPSEQAVEALARCLASGAVQRTVALVAWRQFKAVYEARARRPLLERIVVAATGGGKTPELIEIEGLPPEQQRDRMLNLVREEVTAVLGFSSTEETPLRTGLFDLGMTSLTSVELQVRLEKRLGWRPPTTASFDYPTVEKMAGFVCESLLGSEAGGDERAGRSDASAWTTEPIAIVGIAGRFPGAGNDLSKFRDLLIDGSDLIQEVPPERWDIEAFYDPDPEKQGKMYCRYGSFITDVDQFDPRFFGISPREALNMDPQQRMMLETCWEALENAGISPASMSGTRTGVFIGVTSTEYARVMAASQALEELDPYFLSGNALNAIAGRVSYAFDFAGPAASIDTACSSSLTAIHLACQSLRSHESDAAVAGGVNLTLLPESTLATCRTRMLSADGSCKTFDAAADGYVRGEGGGLIILKRLGDAQRDGDRILAVIRATAINQDGGSSGLTVPNGVAQQALLRDALATAELSPSQIDYVEAHGSGTALGDPIELGALGAVFGGDRDEDERLWVASVKTNLGHLEAAAGIAGLSKVVTALNAGKIPPHLHFKNPTPHVNWDELKLRVPTDAVPWERGDRPRIAGVSSFGFSGTNVHCIIEEPPPLAEREAEWERSRHLLTLSAKAPGALDGLVSAYHAHLDARTDLDFGDVCYTAGTGRTHFNHRIAFAAATREDAVETLRRIQAGEEVEDVSRHTVLGDEDLAVAFLFTGQGSQYVGMARELYETQPVFRRAMDECDALLQDHLERPLLSVIYAESDDDLLNQTAYTQPAIFALQYAMAEMWRSWGIEPTWVSGHSVGEYAAACIAGVFSLADGLKLIAARGRLMQELPAGGGMAAVMAPVERVETAIAEQEGKVTLAGINGPVQTVISGEAEALEQALAKLEAEEVRVKRLQVSHAFHSPLMEPMMDAFADVCKEVTFSAPNLCFISNLTGEAVEAEIATVDYWVRHVREPVRFTSGMTALVADGARVCLELGPRPTLIGMAQQFIDEPDLVWLSTLGRRPEDGDWQPALQSLGVLYTHGAKVDFEAVDCGYARRKVELPSYCFEHQRYWPESHGGAYGGAIGAGMRGAAEDATLGQRLALPHSKEIRFERMMSPTWPAFLGDHRLFGTVVCPGASHIASMLCAADKGLKGVPYVLEDVYFPQALVIEDGAGAAYQLALMPGEERHDYFVQALSFAGDGERSRDDLWNTHASAKLRRAAADEQEPPVMDLDIEAFKSTASHTVEGSAFYEAFWNAGYTLGPSFQWVDCIYRKDWEGVCRMRVPELEEDLADYILHPGLIDSCLQALAGFAKSDSLFMPGGDVIRIPFHVGKVRVFRRPEPGPLWMYGRLEGEDGADPVGLMQLFDDDGNMVAEISGYESRPVSRDVLLAAIKEDVAQKLYEVNWRAVDAVALPEAEAEDAGTWIILNDGPIGDAVAGKLQERGERCVLVSPADAYKQVDEQHYEVDPVNRESFDQLAQEVLSDGPPCRGVLHLWAADATPADEASLDGVNRELEKACGGVLHLLQALAAGQVAQTPRWILATMGAQAVEMSSRPLRVSGAALWGLGRVIAGEHPELGCMRLDLDPDGDVDDHVHNILSEALAVRPDEDQMAYRSQVRYAPRLVHSRRGQTGMLEIPTDGAYRMQLKEFGVLDNLVFNPVPSREPGEGEIEVAVVACGLNFRDVLRALGMLREYEAAVGMNNPADTIFGLECGGRVVSVGSGVTEFKEGDEVVGLAMGSMASHVTLPAFYFVPKPSSLTYEEVVATSFVMMTAIRALEIGADLKAGEKVLIHAASGGVGQAAVMLAQSIGAEVFGTASPPKQQFLRDQGVQHVMNSRTLDFADEIMEITNGEGVDVVLNSLNEEYIPKSLSALKPGGRFIEIGAIGIWDPEQVREFRDDILYERFDMLDEEVSNPGTMSRLLQDVLARLERGDLTPLPHKAFPAPEAVDAFRYVAQAKHIGKVMVSFGDTEAQQGEHIATIREDASYLVTGGLGALGLEVAKWLAERGAKHLALTGRSGAATPEAIEAVDTLKASGVNVLVSKTDVSDPEQVGAMFAELCSGMPPLKGVVHAAGLLADGMLLEMDWEQFTRTLPPKVAGVWNLYQQVADRELDFFVSFSSISSLLGSAGQGNYAAANAFLDAMGEQFHRDGLHGLSINWGPWGDVGMAANLDRRDRARWEASGIGMLSTADGLEMLGSVLGSGGQIAIVPIDWNRLLAGLAEAPLFREIAREVGVTGGGRSEFLEELEETAPERKRDLLLSHVTSEVAKVLGLSQNESLPLETGFFDLGIDSLTAVELRNRLQSSLGTALPATLIFNYPTLGAMINYFADEILDLPASEEDGGDAIAEAPAAPEAFDEESIDDMMDRLREGLTELDESEAE